MKTRDMLKILDTNRDQLQGMIEEIEFPEFDQDQMADELVNFLHNPTDIVPLHGGEKYEVPLLFKGAQLLNDYAEQIENEHVEKNTDEENAELLEYACASGLYRALNARITMDLETVKDATTSEEDRELALERLDGLLYKVGDLYRAVGYITASAVSLQIAWHYTVLNTDKSTEMANHYYDEALKNYYRMRMLLDSKDPESERIMEIMYEGKGFAESGWPDYETPEKLIFKRIPEEHRGELLVEVQNELKEAPGFKR